MRDHSYEIMEWNGDGAINLNKSLKDLRDSVHEVTKSLSYYKFAQTLVLFAMISGVMRIERHKQKYLENIIESSSMKTDPEYNKGGWTTFKSFSSGFCSVVSLEIDGVCFNELSNLVRYMKLFQCLTPAHMTRREAKSTRGIF